MMHNFPLAQLSPFRSLEIGLLARRLHSEGRSIIHMELGQPSTGAPAAALQAARSAMDSLIDSYWESPELKERIAAHYQETYNIGIGDEQIILTCGASPALLLALMSSFVPGQRIAFARPGYIAYRNNVAALHLQPVEIECGPETRFQLTHSQIEALDPAPHGLILSSPANPTGSLIDAPELEAIAATCERRGIRIISDEIYHGLTYEQPAHTILEFSPDALVVNSFSKYFTMVGWRLGWLLAPRSHVARARAYAGSLFLTAPTLSQTVALATMDCRQELAGHVDTYRRNRDLLLAALPSLGLESIAPPDGAFYIYADVAAYTDDSVTFCTKMLLDTGVATAPGVDFDTINGSRFMRFSFAADTADIETAVARLRPWFNSQRRRK